MDGVIMTMYLEKIVQMSNHPTFILYICYNKKESSIIQIIFIYCLFLCVVAGKIILRVKV